MSLVTPKLYEGTLEYGSSTHTTDKPKTKSRSNSRRVQWTVKVESGPRKGVVRGQLHLLDSRTGRSNFVPWTIFFLYFSVSHRTSQVHINKIYSPVQVEHSP